MEGADLEAALRLALPQVCERIYEGQRYPVSFRRSHDGRRKSLLARELAGTDVVSFNVLCPGGVGAVAGHCPAAVRAG